MSRVEEIKNSDFIISIGTFFENDNYRSLIEQSNAKFVYMFPIDKEELKSKYFSFAKYEVGSEEAVLALILNFFAINYDSKTKDFLEDLDLGYLSAECSVGEEEFEDIFSISQEIKDGKTKSLIIGDDILNHPRCENVLNILKLIEKYTDLNILFLNDALEEKFEKKKDADECLLEDVEDLKSFNGTVVYKLLEESKYLISSQTFANIAKVKDGDSILVISKDETFKKVLKIDENLNGTIALLGLEDLGKNYRYSQVKIEKSE